MRVTAGFACTVFCGVGHLGGRTWRCNFEMDISDESATTAHFLFLFLCFLLMAVRRADLFFLFRRSEGRIGTACRCLI
ncbi:uncharacterized protein BO72DRAFT_247116 [Aspergillus fijiensis CBS 313.89]|uniref:Uncharacterized protein n=1 Tax=Aspergillus fijiensis CBS 313.89 TaxID=1448319 RepID=A0A8G1RH56_9EURO|nr:uncharacterized protein BO72DRAFT_247116 [Aspergillus fijiensis CBS 313.89]RAK73250.1 hypothetical protein BO72DRAFT_247116 [Aspergillus fijiensis CBS 313.89]